LSFVFFVGNSCGNRKWPEMPVHEMKEERGGAPFSVDTRLTIVRSLSAVSMLQFWTNLLFGKPELLWGFINALGFVTSLPVFISSLSLLELPKLERDVLAKHRDRLKPLARLGAGAGFFLIGLLGVPSFVLVREFIKGHPGANVIDSVPLLLPVLIVAGAFLAPSIAFLVGFFATGLLRRALPRPQADWVVCRMWGKIGLALLAAAWASALLSWFLRNFPV